MDSEKFLGSGSKSLADLQRESALDGLAHSINDIPENFAEIDIVEPSPTKDWKLPPLSPDEVYQKVKKFQLKASTSIKIKEKAIQCRATQNQMMNLELIDRKDVDDAIKKGYSYMHIGCIKIGINPLHRAGQNVYCYSAVLDKRWFDFTQALLGGAEAPLNAGPVVYDIRPNYAVSLHDPNIMSVLTLGTQTLGYERFMGNSLNIGIHYSTCVRFTNTQVQAVKNADKNTVTIMSYDEGLQPSIPQQIPKSRLRPPDNWITDWAQHSVATQPKNMSQAQIVEEDGRVVTRFPRSLPQSSQLQRGGSSRSLSHSGYKTASQIPSYQIDPQINLQNIFQKNHERHSRLQPPTTVRVLAPKSYAVPKTCSHPECSQAECSQCEFERPFGHNSRTIPDNMLNVHEAEPTKLQREIWLALENARKGKQDKHGVGYFKSPLPPHRLKKTQFDVTESEIRKVLNLLKGVSPYNPQDSWMKKMINWDVVTHEKVDGFVSFSQSQPNPVQFRQTTRQEWLKYMEENNLWISFYEWYFSKSTDEKVETIEDQQINQVFREKEIQDKKKFRKILQKENSPKKRKSEEISSSSELEEDFFKLQLGESEHSKALVLVKPSDLAVINMHNAEESSEPPPKKSTEGHYWRRPDGQDAWTNMAIPPYINLQDQDKNGRLTDFVHKIKNSQNEVVHMLNWTNLALTHGIEHTHDIIMKVEQEVKRDQGFSKRILKEIEECQSSQNHTQELVVNMSTEVQRSINTILSDNRQINDAITDIRGSHISLVTHMKKIAQDVKSLQQQRSPQESISLGSPTVSIDVPSSYRKKDKGPIFFPDAENPLLTQRIGYESYSIPVSPPTFGKTKKGEKYRNPYYSESLEPGLQKIVYKATRERLPDSDEENAIEVDDADIFTIEAQLKAFDQSIISNLRNMSLNDQSQETDYESSSGSYSEQENEENCINSPCQQSEINFQMPKWKTRKRENIYPRLYVDNQVKMKEFRADTIYPWSVDDKTTAEIEQTCEDMVTAFRAYISAGKSVDQAYDLVVSGFNDALQNWYRQKEAILPGQHKLWKMSILVHTDEKIAAAAGAKVGEPILDIHGNKIFNGIGNLCWEIREEFCGFPHTQANMDLFYLQKMKCTDLTQFESYYAKFIKFVFKTSNPLDVSWKQMFIASLPTWFQQHLYEKNEFWQGPNPDDLSKSSWGEVKQGCEALILATCSHMRLQKATEKARAGGLYKDLCKQRDLPYRDPDRHKKHFSSKSQKSSRFRAEMGGDSAWRSKKSKSKKGKYKKYKFRKHAKSSKYYPEKSRTSHKEAYTGKDKRRESSRRDKKKKEISCYNTEKPTLVKIKEENPLEEIRRRKKFLAITAEDLITRMNVKSQLKRKHK